MHPYRIELIFDETPGSLAVQAGWITGPANLHPDDNGMRILAALERARMQIISQVPLAPPTIVVVPEGAAPH